MENSDKKTNTETTYKKIVVRSTPFIVLGLCIGFGWRYVSRAWDRKPKQETARSMCFAAIHGGRLALERLVDYKNYSGKPEDNDGDIKELENLLANERPNYRELQRVLARLEMSKKEDEAIKVLNKALEKAKKEDKSHEVYEIEMLLVEMYIYKGEVQKALNCKCLVDHEGFSESDARPFLFKAIISIMNQKEKEGLEWWKKFKDIQPMSFPPDCHDEEFNEFKKAVDLLKQDINDAKQLKKAKKSTKK